MDRARGARPVLQRRRDRSRGVAGARAANGPRARGGGATQATPQNHISPIAGSGRTNDESFSQPIITFDENQLIIAEAALQTNDRATAATAFNAVRTAHGKPTIGSPTLADIMNEKYIALFQNVETWNDYKRTCLPTMHPARGRSVIPGRIFYGATEEQTNPRTDTHPLGTPPSSAQNLFTVRNANRKSVV